ncbi:MAG: ABC transporter permease [Cyanobacteriota bacterium]|nr:ABC transporter permease [Cyanobacteriota bacterium]
MDLSFYFVISPTAVPSPVPPPSLETEQTLLPPPENRDVPENVLKQKPKQGLGIALLLGPPGLWLLLLLVLPVLVIFELSLVPGIRPGDLVNPSGLDNYFQAFDPINLRVLARSLFFATGTTLLCLVLGFPVAYWIALMTPQKWRNLLLLGFILPLWTSSLLRSYAWITILRPTGVLNSALTFLGLPVLDLLNRSPAVLIGMAYSYLPYMVLILYASLEKLDGELLEASADLGATPWQTFWKITIPQIFPGIAAGSLLVFITGLGDFVDPELLGGASSMTVSRLIYNQFLGASRNWGFGSALSMILIFAVSVSIALLIKYGDRDAASDA